MASEAEHLEQFDRNMRASRRLADIADYDWAVTVLFYAALHLTQSWFVRNGRDVENHSRREQEMRTSPDLRPIFEGYRALRLHSENARYECRRFSALEYEAIREGVFGAVVDHLQSLRGDA